jgi:hypothetical protein
LGVLFGTLAFHFADSVPHSAAFLRAAYSHLKAAPGDELHAPNNDTANEEQHGHDRMSVTNSVTARVADTDADTEIPVGTE